MEQKKEALWIYIKKKFDLEIPRLSICHNHQAPFDFLSAAFFEQYDLIVALANRSGGKTMDFAVLVILDSLANDDCECANFGAIQQQALRCYGYVRDFIEKNKEFYDMVRNEMTMKKTTLQNNSMIQILTATMSGVNSPHPQKVKADEVELIPWNILQEALSMTQSRGDIQGVTILGSTRKFAHGPMQRLIDDNEAKLFIWCIYEVMEKWPEDPLLQEQIKQTFTKKFGDLELLPKDLSRFTGYYRWTDLLTKIRSLDKETFLTQWLCQKPDTSGLVYPMFDEVLNVNPNFTLDPTLPIQIWEDIGYAKDHPDVVLFVQVDVVQMRWTVFDEIYFNFKDTQDIIINVIEKLNEYGLVDKGLTLDPNVLYKMDRYQEYFTHLAGWVADYHNVVALADRQRFGLPIWDKVRKTENEDVGEIYKQKNYIPLVRGFLDDRTGKITPKVIKCRDELLCYSKKKRIDGTYLDEPEKRNDNGPSALAFGCIRNWPNLAYQQFDKEGNEYIPTASSHIPEEAISPATYTGGIWSKEF